VRSLEVVSGFFNLKVYGNLKTVFIMEKIPHNLLIEDLMKRLEIQKNINESYRKKLRYANTNVKNLNHEINTLKGILTGVYNKLDKQLNQIELKEVANV